MKNQLVILLLFCIYKTYPQSMELSIDPNHIQKKQINFQNLSFEELKAKAKKENKPLFINISASWCMPCQDMKKNVFTDWTVADYYNPNFVNASFEYNNTEGNKISEEYNINSYPHYLFFNASGEMIHERSGFLSPEEFIKEAQRAKNPKQNLAYYKKEYPNKSSDPEFLINYLTLLENASGLKLTDGFISFNIDPLFEKRDSILNQYFALQKEEELSNRKNWEAIRDFTYDLNSREFKYLLKNEGLFKKLYSSDSVSEKIEDVLFTGRNLARKNRVPTEANEQAYIDEIKKLNTPESDVVVFWLQLDKAKGYQKFEEYMRLVNEAGSKYLVTAQEKERVSKVIYENINTKEALEKAELLMESAFMQQPSWLICETYANVLYLLNKRTEAKKMALLALEEAKNIGAKKENYNSITYLLEKIDKL